VSNREKVWIIDERFVSEPFLGGMQLGELPEFDLSGYEITARITQEQFDQLMEEYFEQEGYYPDT
jgi:hypothetical protein